MAVSRTSGRVSEAEKAQFVRRKGNPGGARSEAQKQGLRIRIPRAPAIDAAMLRAFLTGDAAYFRRVLQLEPWQDSPLNNRPAVCTQGHPIETPMPVGYGCG